MDSINVAGPIDVMREAEQFLSEIADKPVERAKKAIAAASELQAFLLFVRANCLVPKHQVKGPITVQTLIGHAQMAADGSSHDLPKGNVVSFAANVPHDVSAVVDSILLVTHALPHI